MNDMFVVPISEFDRERLLSFARPQPASEDPFYFRKSGTRNTASKRIIEKAMQDFNELNDTAREEEIEQSLSAFSRQCRMNNAIQDDTFEEDELSASFCQAIDEGRDRLLAKIDRGDFFMSSGNRGNQLSKPPTQHIGPLFPMLSADLPQTSGTAKNKNVAKKKPLPNNIPAVLKSIRKTSNRNNLIQNNYDFGMNSANSTISLNLERRSSMSKDPTTRRMKSPATKSLKNSTNSSSQNVKKVSTVLSKKSTKKNDVISSKISSAKITKKTTKASSSPKPSSPSSVNEDCPRRYVRRASRKPIDYSDDRNYSNVNYGISNKWNLKYSKAQKLSSRSSSSEKRKVENKISENSTSSRNATSLSSENLSSSFNRRYGKRSSTTPVNYSESRNKKSAKK